MKRIVIIICLAMAVNIVFAQPTATLKIGTIYDPLPGTVLVPITCEEIYNPVGGVMIGWYIAYDTNVLYAGEPGTMPTLINYYSPIYLSCLIQIIIEDNPVPGWNTIALIWSCACCGEIEEGAKFFDIQFTYTEGLTDEPNIIWTSLNGFETNMADDEGNEFLLTLIDGYVGPYYAFDVLFHVTDNTGIPVEGALVAIDSLSVLTDTNGMAAFILINGNYDYTITKYGFEPKTGSFTIAGSPLTIEETLNPGWEVTFHVTSGGINLEGVMLTVENDTVITDINGIAMLYFPDGSYVYTATKEGYYFEQDAFTVSGSPVNVEIVMIPEPVYTVAIHVTSGGIPLDSAAVIIGNDTVFTDEGGSAVFELINGIYDFTVVKQGYITWTGSFSVVNGPVNIEVVLVPQEYMVVFHITSGGENLSGAEVQIGSSIVTTGPDGIAQFNLINGTYNYLVTKENFYSQSGQITVNNSNITIEIDMLFLPWPITLYFISQGTGVDNVNVTCNDTTKITNASGGVTFFLYCDSSYMLFASKDGYIDFNISFTLNCMAQPYVFLMVTQNLTFHCTSGGQNIQGVSLTLDGYGTQTSGFDGKAMFSIIPDGTYLYTSHKEGYLDKMGTVTLNNASQTVEVNLKCEVTFEIFISNISSTEPLEGAQVTCGDSVLITPENGTVVFNLENGIYLWSVTHPDFIGSIEGDLTVNGAPVLFPIIIFVGVFDNASNSIMVYPNPSTGKFLIKTGDQNKTNGVISVFDLAGNPVYTSEMQEIKNDVIDISSQPPGSYILKISNGEESFEKVIIIE